MTLTLEDLKRFREIAHPKEPQKLGQWERDPVAIGMERSQWNSLLDLAENGLKEQLELPPYNSIKRFDVSHCASPRAHFKLTQGEDK